MNVDLTQLRANIAQALDDAGIDSRDYLATSLDPPCAVVVPANPYVQQAGPGRSIVFDSVRARVDVLLLAYVDDPKAERSSERIDQMIVTALTALAPFDVGDFTQPGVIQISGSSFLGSVTTIEHDEEL